MRVIVPGAPGTNKFILAINVSTRYHLRQYSYRFLVLDYMKSNKADSKEIRFLWSQSLSFPPGLAFKVVEKYLFDKKVYDNFVLDGYPKGASEAELLKNYLIKNNNNTHSYSIILNEKITKIYTIMKSKMICPNCSYILNTIIINPIFEQKCPYCHTALIKGELKENTNKQQIEESYNRYRQEVKGIKSNLKDFSKVLVFSGKEYQSELINKVFSELDKNEH